MSTEKMRYWIFDGPGEMRIETKSVPDPGPGELRLRVARVGICGSDIHGYAGESGLRKPGIVMGHEASGFVDRLGPGVEGLDVGEPVTFAPTLACDGACGHTSENRCAQLRLVGVTPGLPGAFADYVVLPAHRFFRLGELSLEHGASVEPMAVGLHAARRGGVRDGSNVLVIGGGMIGQAAAQAARMEGAARVTISDPLAARRDVAIASGFAATAPDALAGRFDLVIEAVGIPATLEAAIGAVVPGGVVCLVGLGARRVSFTVFDLVGPERSIVGSECYTDAEFRETIAALADGRLDLAPLAPVDIGFEDIGDALAALAGGTDQSIKVSALLAG